MQQYLFKMKDQLNNFSSLNLNVFTKFVVKKESRGNRFDPKVIEETLTLEAREMAKEEVRYQNQYVRYAEGLVILLYNVIIDQLEGYIDSTKLNHTCRFSKVIYGLKQTPRS